MILKRVLLKLYIIDIYLKNNIFTFILPNIRFMLKRKVTFAGKYPLCQQKLIFSGEGSVLVGELCSFGYKLGGFYRGGCIEIQSRFKQSIIKIGKNVSTNNNVFICAANNISIGDDTLIGQNVTIMDYEGHGVEPENRSCIGVIGNVIIGKNVWIGNNVIILKNTEVGENCIIAAGAIVTGKFPSNVIIGGVPAKIIRSI
jgi:acetyltransferase-like isoleucine patch superfamily enzyme